MKIMSSSEEEAEFNGDDSVQQDKQHQQEDDDDDDDDDVPLANLKNDRKRSATAVKVSYVDNDDDDDSDSDDSEDDIPLASLIKKVKPKSATKSKSKSKPSPKASPKKKAKTKPASKPSASTSSTSSSSNSKKKYDSASAALYGTECDKGILIQRLLCRWWYAYQWPDPATIPAKPPKNYDALDGFVGVYVCTAGDKVGDIKDLRNPQTRPSFGNFASKTTQELKDLLLTALQEQKKVLVQHEGAGTAAEKELTRLVKWANKLKADKADKEAAKVLKASRLELP